MAVVERIGLPVIIRPAYILGGRGTGIASTQRRVRGHRRGRASTRARSARSSSRRSIVGWKEFELEVMRDRADNCVVVCSIENFDPMGVHTGDSITVAPAQTLSDVEYQVDARRRVRVHPPRRRRDRRQQHPVRGRADHRRDGRHRDEPTGEPLVGARVEGDRASRSRRSRRGSRSGTRSTRSRTTSPG